jgi:hypothetical protein
MLQSQHVTGLQIVHNSDQLKDWWGPSFDTLIFSRYIYLTCVRHSNCGLDFQQGSKIARL